MSASPNLGDATCQGPLMETLQSNIDSSTPAEADEELPSSRRASSQGHRCLLEVWKRPGQTAAEIAVATGLRRHVPSRRLPELRRAGEVRTGAFRRCNVTGNLSLTWFPALKEAA
jgi:hypothetical protein